jgi:hypothetical protein
MVRRLLNVLQEERECVKFSEDSPDDHDKRVTYYDADRHDRHEWNEQEERAYRHWIEEERHQKYRDFKHASKQQQREYWEWRHAHSDWR